MESDMAASNLWMAIACAAACGSAGAQPVVEKPAPSRFYGTARPPSVSPAPSGPGHVAPPAAVRPPAYRPPASVQARPPQPIHVHPSRPRVGVDVWVGPRPWPYYGYGPRYVYPGWPYPPAYPPTYPAYPSTIYVPPPVVVSPPPVVYVERATEAESPPSGYWYWCVEPQGWYPEVADCPAGWQPVPPRAVGQ
jgi:hypothetical protein